MKKIILSSMFLAVAAASQAAVVFTDNFDTNSAANYDVVNGPESTAQFGFNYTGLQVADQTAATPSRPAAAIPSAPGQTGTTALRLEANPTSNAAQGVTVYPKNLGITAGQDITITFYAFQRVNGAGTSWAGGSGSSQALVAGVNHADATKVINGRNGFNANLPGSLSGYYFYAMGDAGFGFTGVTDATQANYGLVEGNPSGNATPTTQSVTWAYGPTVTTDYVGGLHSSNGFEALFGPANQYYYAGGTGDAPGDKWTKYELKLVAATGTVTVKINDTLVATYDDPNDTFVTPGRVSIGIYDPTNSFAGAGNGYTLVDGLTVDATTPAAPTDASAWELYN